MLIPLLLLLLPFLLLLLPFLLLLLPFLLLLLPFLLLLLFFLLLLLLLFLLLLPVLLLLLLFLAVSDPSFYPTFYPQSESLLSCPPLSPPILLLAAPLLFLLFFHLQCFKFFFSMLLSKLVTCCGISPCDCVFVKLAIPRLICVAGCRNMWLKQLQLWAQRRACMLSAQAILVILACQSAKSQTGTLQRLQLPACF